MTGKVYFLGAGPGDPDLLTQRAARILRSAEVVLHDALVSPEILALISPRATIRDVGKRCGQKSIAQAEIHRLMIHEARMGRCVVRLQGGDPLIFGRAGEEIEALESAGVEFEIVPGVTAASAAAAAARIPLTDRRSASRVLFLTAHRREGLLREDLHSLPAGGTTLAIYMPGADYEHLARELLAAGLRADTPCVIASSAGTPRELLCRTTLRFLAATPPLPAPALLIVGPVAAFAKEEDRAEADSAVCARA